MFIKEPKDEGIRMKEGKHKTESCVFAVLDQARLFDLKIEKYTSARPLGIHIRTAPDEG